MQEVESYSYTGMSVQTTVNYRLPSDNLTAVNPTNLAIEGGQVLDNARTMQAPQDILARPTLKLLRLQEKHRLSEY